MNPVSVNLNILRSLRFCLQLFRSSRIYMPSIRVFSRITFLYQFVSIDRLAAVFPTCDWNRIKIDDELSYSFFSDLDDFWSSKLFWSSRANIKYEDEVWQLIDGLNLENSLFIDIGAHTGYWSICLKLKNPSLDVIAFEPHPLVYNRLEQNVARNNVDISIESIAIGNRNGSFSFYSQPGIPCSSSLSKDFMLSFSNESELICYSGPVMTLDVFAKKITKHYKTVVVKLDVEGTEIDVLEKATDFLIRFKPILILEVLSDSQYEKIKLFLIKQNYTRLENLQSCDKSDIKTPNFIAYPNQMFKSV
jgi:FkbM family methyltransferase